MILYDYKDAMCEDIREWLEDSCYPEQIKETAPSVPRKILDNLYNDMAMDDSITGSASGSYFCNAWKAEDALAHNLDLLRETLRELEIDFCSKSVEELDVIVRCYIFDECLGRVLNEDYGIIGAIS